jgi:putative SOS response-associated peptidase YedK
VCTNFSSTRNNAWVNANLGVTLPPQYPEQAYPGHQAPMVVQSLKSGRIACGLARFGLIPDWAKEDKIARYTYNARTETVADKPSYRKAWRQRQYGLVLVDHFYEPRYDTGRAVRWKIALASGEPFGLACLWDRWIEPRTGEPVVSFSLLTINADQHPVMNQFHKAGEEKRTPVIIPPERHRVWLSAEPAHARALLATAQPLELQTQAAPALA